MGKALEVITGIVTAPGGTATALTMAAGNSNTVRNTDNDAAIRLLETWQAKQAAGFFRIRSPRLHDNVVGIQMRDVIAVAMPTYPLGVSQKLYSQDTLTMELTGSAVAGDIETASILVYYDDLPGIDARLIDSDELIRRAVNSMSSEVILNFGAAGNYSGQASIVSTQDNFKANTDYALVGYVVSALCATVRWQGADTGNLGVGGPGDPKYPQVTSQWFKLLSDQFKLPMIPVFNSANKNAILVDGAQDENAAQVRVSSILVELSS